MIWNKVTDSLPDINTPVLVYDNRRQKMAVSMRMNKCNSVTNVKMWEWINLHNCDITHWAHLPPTPLEEAIANGDGSCTTFNPEKCIHYVTRYGKCKLTRITRHKNLIRCDNILKDIMTRTGKPECPNYKCKQAL